MAKQAVQLGYVAGAHGVHGAVRVKLFNAESTVLAPGLRLRLRLRGLDQDGQGRELEVTRVAPKPGSDQVRLWLAGIDDRAAAEALRGHELWVARAQLPALDRDEYYLADLIGLEVVRTRDEGHESLGEIGGVTSNGAQDLLCVNLGGREWLLPALPPFVVDIDPVAGRVLVDVHDDMLPETDD